MLSRANLEIYQGDDYAAVVTVLTGTGLPADLTGCTAQAQIRTAPADWTSVVVTDIVTAFILPNLISLSIPKTITVCLSGSYFWDLQLTLPGGVVTTILAGAANVTREVTRPVTVLAALVAA